MLRRCSLKERSPLKIGVRDYEIRGELEGGMCESQGAVYSRVSSFSSEIESWRTFQRAARKTMDVEGEDVEVVGVRERDGDGHSVS